MNDVASRNRIWQIILIVFPCVFTIHAQPSTPVSVVIEGDCGAFPKGIAMVMNGDENDAFDLKETDDGWSKTWKHEDPLAFSASLRLRGARTFCRAGKVYRHRVEFTFACDHRTTRLVTIDVNAKTAFSYVRILPNNSSDKRDCACYEFGHAPPGRRQIKDVLFPYETLRLQLDRSMPSLQAPGLTIDHFVIPHAEIGGQKTLDTSQIRDAMEKQRRRRTLPANDLTWKMLNDGDIKSIAIRVE